jgi:ubiquinone/menaquinone biosynthesis C-methylase UbiE
MTEDRAGDTKRCCARLYESEFVSLMLGDSYHPGGLALTERLGTLLGLSPDGHTVDVASGTGASALHLAERFGCRVSGFDLSQRNVDRANARAAQLGLADRVRFACGDAERLPLADGSVDAVVCECAFCTFPDKPQAAREFARVLRPGGRAGLSDITRAGGDSDDLNDLMAWIACLADARSTDTYAGWLATAGLAVSVIEPHDDAVSEMVRSIGVRLLAADVLAALQKIDLAGVDLAAARRLAGQARVAVDQGRIGYALVCATRA